MKLILVPSTHIDQAWSEGASRLADACAASGGEITADQLKLILSRGERTLVRMDVEDSPVGWGVIRVDQLPNLRVLHICEMSATGAQFEQFFTELKTLAKAFGCSRIRCAAKPAQARLYRMKCGFTPVYETLEVSL
jgi:hypothetical protein